MKTRKESDSPAPETTPPAFLKKKQRAHPPRMSPTFCKEGAYPIEVRKAIISASSAIASVRANPPLMRKKVLNLLVILRLIMD